MNLLTARVIARYIAGYLVLRGIIPQDIADLIADDPELAALIGAGLAAAIEWLTAQARKRGWKT